MKNKLIRPTYHAPLMIIRAVLVLSFPPFVFLIIFPIMISLANNLSLPFVIFLAVIPFALLFFILYFAAGYYRNAIFNVGADLIVYDVDFLTRKRKEVLFINVKEVELKAGILQRLFGLGNVILHTHATVAGNRHSGLILYDLENSDEVYDFLKKEVAKVTKERRI